jgi:hypothetical protein
MMSSIKKALLNIPGWRTNRKLVVFESDDWGSIRMPSISAFERLTAKGLDLSSADSLRYNMYDTLASSDDLSALFDVLQKFKGADGRSAVFTAFSLVANPDFSEIRKHDYQSYHYETLVSTLSRYYPNQDVFSLWKQGMSERLFSPQFHGREHLNIKIWLNDLQKKDPQTIDAFNEGMWGYNNRHQYNISYQAAFDLESTSDLDFHRAIMKDGLHRFEEIMGYKASVFVPPNGLLHESLYHDLREQGIKYLFSSKLHKVPQGAGNVKTKIHFIGNRNAAKQKFIIRNAFFEPSTGDHHTVARCLNDIKIAFAFKKPAVISTHRVNFIGELYEKNRNRGLQQLQELLSKITSTWPDVEFITSHDLGELMNS